MMTEYLVLNEIGVGIIALLLLMLTAGLVHYIFTHRVTLTVEDRDARLAAIGLATVFGALAVRSLVRWMSLIDERGGLEFPTLFNSPVFFISTLAIAMLGAILTLRAFHPWPISCVFITASILIPILAAFA